MLCSSEQPLVGRNLTQRAAARETSCIVVNFGEKFPIETGAYPPPPKVLSP
jgi:hypothetical protein